MSEQDDYDLGRVRSIVTEGDVVAGEEYVVTDIEIYDGAACYYIIDGAGEGYVLFDYECIFLKEMVNEPEC